MGGAGMTMRRKWTTWRAAVVFGLTVVGASAARAAEPGSILLRPARVSTADDAVAHAGWVVLVTGRQIVAVGPPADIQAPSGARVIDLPGDTLLPGLMDIHSHMFLHPCNEAAWDDQVLKVPLAYRTLHAGRQATATLMPASLPCVISARKAQATLTSA